MIRMKSILWAAVLLSFLLSSLYLNSANAVYAQTNTTVHVAMSAVTSLDPLKLSRADGTPNDSARDLVENVFVGLTRYNSLTDKVEPLLARDWQTSPDGLTWTFHLRDDVQWVKYDPTQNAVVMVRPISAGDVVYGLRRACDPRLSRPATNAIDIIAGCRLIATTDPQKITDVTITQMLGATVVDSHTVQIVLAFPAVYFPALLTLPEFRPIPREAIAKAAASGNANSDWTQADALMTSGPWAIQSWATGQQMTLVRNPTWTDKIDGSVTTISADFTNPTADSVQRLAINATAPAGETIESAPESIVVLGFSAERVVTQPDVIRRALALAIDRNGLVKALQTANIPGAANWQAASHFTPTGITPDNSGYDPAKAKVAITSSTIPGCSRVPEKFDFVTDGSPTQIAIETNLFAQWKATLGCPSAIFTTETVKADKLLAITRATTNSDLQINASALPRPHLWIASWSADYPDANAWSADGLHCQYGYLRTNVTCADADTQLDKAGIEADPAKRQTEYAQAETSWFSAGGTFPVAPLYVTLTQRAHPGWLTEFADHGAFRFDQWLAAAH
jgi:oligopeptide transport system substrate-binding protein